MRKNVTARNAEMRLKARAGATARALADEYGLSRPQVYRILDAAEPAPGRGWALETFAAASAAPAPGEAAGGDRAPMTGLTKSMLERELARTGLRRTAGTGQLDIDYDRTFRRGLAKRVALYREMGDDPVVASVLNAINMVIQRASWYVEPAGETNDDKAAAEFVEGALHDMSRSWTSIVADAMTMVQYGFALAELVYKPRKGAAGDPASKYDDKRIGWRKFTFLLQDSLASGAEWDFDDYGGVRGVNQAAAPEYRIQYLPIEKLCLFRLGGEGNNPEGRSLLRAMYIPWYLKRNLEDVESISAERMGSGMPVIYLGEDASINPLDANSDYTKAQEIVRNVRVDEQMGLVVPFAKMGGGAREGQGALFEFASPSGHAVDFNSMITRHEQRIAMVGLGQFLMLGLSKVGTQALAVEQGDFFTMAADAILGSMADTLNRHAVERLIRLNHFPKLTAYPILRTEPVGKVDAAAMAETINKYVGAQLITPGEELEKYVRRLLELPEQPAAMYEGSPISPVMEDEAAAEGAKALGIKPLKLGEGAAAEAEVEGTEGESAPVAGDEAEVEAPEGDGPETASLEAAGETFGQQKNFQARRGQTIMGNLRRGQGGRFESGGGGGGQPGIRPTSTPTPNSVAAQAGLSNESLFALASLAKGGPVGMSQGAALIAAGLAQPVSGGMVLTQAGKDFLAAVQRGDAAGAIAVARGAATGARGLNPDGSKAGGGKGGGGKGGGGKGDKPKEEKKGGKGKEEKPKEEKKDKEEGEASAGKKPVPVDVPEAERKALVDMAKAEAGIKDRRLAEVYLSFSVLAGQGGPLANGLDLNKHPEWDEDDMRAMTVLGFAARGADGLYTLTARGRQFAAAGRAGDTAAARRALGTNKPDPVEVAEQLKPGESRTGGAEVVDPEKGNRRVGIMPVDPESATAAELVADEFAAGHTGVMVALWPKGEQARAMALPGGEAANDLHLTLVMLSEKGDDLTPERAAYLDGVVRGFAATERPVAGYVTGPGVFAPGPAGERPLVALVDAPDLGSMRERLVAVLHRVGYAVSMEHGFTPHITLDYSAAAEVEFPNLINMRVEFETLVLAIGGRRQVFNLTPAPWLFSDAAADPEAEAFHLPGRHAQQDHAGGKGGHGGGAASAPEGDVPIPLASGGGGAATDSTGAIKTSDASARARQRNLQYMDERELAIAEDASQSAARRQEMYDRGAITERVGRMSYRDGTPIRPTIDALVASSTKAKIETKAAKRYLVEKGAGGAETKRILLHSAEEAQYARVALARQAEGIPPPPGYTGSTWAADPEIDSEALAADLALLEAYADLIRSEQALV